MLYIFETQVNLSTHFSPSNMLRFPGKPMLECWAHAWKCLPRSALGVAARWWAKSFFSYLTESETKALDATCYDVCLWTEIHFPKWLRIPMVESDAEKAAWYRLWGPYNWLSWLPWKWDNIGGNVCSAFMAAYLKQIWKFIDTYYNICFKI